MGGLREAEEVGVGDGLPPCSTKHNRYPQISLILPLSVSNFCRSNRQFLPLSELKVGANWYISEAHTFTKGWGRKKERKQQMGELASF